MKKSNGALIIAVPWVGWQAKLYLVLQYIFGKTYITRQQHSGPLRIQRAFYPELEVCHIYLLHPPNGIVGGDSLSTTIELQSNTKVLITTPGSTKIYQSKGMISKIEHVFFLQSGSELEWLPSSNIFFPGCKINIKNEFYLQNNTKLITWDTFCFGRPVLGELFEYGNITILFRFWFEGKLLLNEVLRINDNIRSTAGYALHSTVIIFPGNPILLNLVRKISASRQCPSGVTMLNNVMILRFLDNDNLKIEQDIHKIWCLARQHVFSRKAVLPRIWST